jgi:hypothetical protein
MAKRIEDLEMADNAKELGLNHEPEGISMTEAKLKEKNHDR